MEIPVLIEPIAQNGFCARAVEPFALAAEAGTREEALQKLRELMEARLVGGAEIVSLQFPAQEHPLARFAGMFKGDPYFDDWQRAIAEYRRQIEDDSETP